MQNNGYLTNENLDKKGLKYFLFRVRAAHLGCGKHGELNVPTSGVSIVDAMDQALKIPAIQRGKGVLSGKPITREEYEARMAERYELRNTPNAEKLT